MPSFRSGQQVAEKSKWLQCWRAKTALADLLTPLLVANPFSAMRATLLWWLGDEFEDGLKHGWQGWLMPA
jgi:hypothetical protein